MGRAVLTQEAVGNEEGGLRPGGTKDISVGAADNAVTQVGGLRAAVD